jgi:hypothetical protein
MNSKKSPTPPSNVGGTGSPCIPSSRTIAGEINYQYRPDFPENSKTHILEEQILARRDFNEKSAAVRSERELRAMRFACAMRPTLAFAREAIRKMRLRWGESFISSLTREFIRAALTWAGLPADAEFEDSAEWKQFEDELLKSAEPPPTQSPTPGAKKPRQSLEPRPELLVIPDASLSRLRAAEALGITPRTLDRWVKDRKLTPFGAGIRNRFKAKDLQRILNQKSLDKRDRK